MELIFKTLNEGHNQLSFAPSQEALNLAPADLFLMNPVGVSLTVIKTQDKLTCQAQMFALAQPECARCLKLFSARLKTEISFVLDQGEQALRNEFEDDDYEFLPKSQAGYDLTPRVREALLLAVPMRFLCTPDCKGLCPHCGINLNMQACTHSQEEVDPRWGALQRLLK